MCAFDKLKKAAPDLSGKAKEAGGKVTNNEQSAADANKAGGHAKDACQH